MRRVKAKYRRAVKRYCSDVLRATGRWAIDQIKRQSLLGSLVTTIGVGWIVLCAVAIGLVNRAGKTITAGLWPTAPEPATYVLWASIGAIGVIGLIGFCGIGILVKKVFGYGRETRSIRQLFSESILGGVIGTVYFFIISHSSRFGPCICIKC